MPRGRLHNSLAVAHPHLNGRHEVKPKRRRAVRSKSDALITANEIIRKYGLSYQTLNFYTNMGLLTVVKKASNQRFYKEADLRKRLKLITKLKDLGYPLQLIRRILSSKEPKVIG